MDADTVMGTELRGLRRRRPEVAGTVLAGTDGLLISSDLPATDATHLAALAAASFGLGHRVADTVRQGEFRESVVHTAAGAVVTYPAGRNALLKLVADGAADLAALHDDARAVARRTGSVLDTRRGPIG
ncbi:roadblock/LC7 domain-containing protein, partial [Micromonospora phytophila]|uniref:roadblock/LC7 domain-containing protein n=1 Tax=Micromonospora phytophila TaxID=709888 RepID=UPI00203054FC